MIFWIITFIVLLIIFFGAPYALFLIFKKFNKHKLGAVFGIGTFVIFSAITIYVIFEDNFFFQESAIKELNQVNLKLNDDFEILKNESGGFTDYYHIFKLKISEKDAKRLTKNKDLNGNEILVKRLDIEPNIWKEVRIDTTNNILIYEYIIN